VDETGGGKPVKSLAMAPRLAVNPACYGLREKEKAR